MKENELKNLGYIIKYDVYGYDIHFNDESVRGFRTIHIAGLTEMPMFGAFEIVERHKNYALAFAEQHYINSQTEAG